MLYIDVIIAVDCWVIPIAFFSNVISYVINGTICVCCGMGFVLLSYLICVVVYCCVLWTALVRIIGSCVV